MDTILYTPKDYGPAIYLALNHAAGGLEILDYIYSEDNDVWYIEVQQGKYHDYGFVLEGQFVRTCYKATKRGVTSWVEKT